MSQTFGDWDSNANNNTTVGAGAINIAEGCPPGNINDAIREVMAAAVRSWGGQHSGMSRPAGVQAGRFWLDTSNATAPVLKWFDGTDDIPFMTIDYSANTITLDSGVVVPLADGSITTAKLADNAVTLAKMADLASGVILGRSSAGTGDPEALTGTQVTALLDVFTSTAKGLAPASGGGTTNFLRADGTWAAPPTWTQMTAKSASGTSVEFTGIPSTAKVVKVMFSGISFNVADDLMMRIGPSGGVETTGYASVVGNAGGDNDEATAFRLTRAPSANETDTYHGMAELANLTGNTWCLHSSIATPEAKNEFNASGSKALGGSLARVQLFALGGASFDAGTINILYM